MDDINFKNVFLFFWSGGLGMGLGGEGRGKEGQGGFVKLSFNFSKNLGGAGYSS